MRIEIFCLFFTFTLHAALIDKVAAIFNDEVLSYSLVKRVKSTLPQRNQLAPNVYPSLQLSEQEVVNILVNIRLKRISLKESGFIMSDDQVESNIAGHQDKLGISREDLIIQLKNSGINFEEYFELIRAALEHSLFEQRIIYPLISISDQEVKNEYFKQNSNAKTFAAKYDVVLFNIPVNKTTRSKKSDIIPDLQSFQRSGILPNYLKDMETKEINQILSENLDIKIESVLRQTQEQTFSRPIEYNNNYSVFFVKQKTMVESENYKYDKEVIRNLLKDRKSTTVQDLWFKNEAQKHFIKTLL